MKKTAIRGMRLLLGAMVLGVALVGAGRATADVAKIELHLLETVTLTDEQFLTGDRNGPRATLAAELRLPPGSSPRVPALVMMQGSGGFIDKDDRWSRHFNDLGIATLLVDSFTGRGIVDTVGDQSQLGSLTMMNDAYRALELLARHPRIDPARIAIFGGSKGAVAALYSSVRRFQRMHGPAEAQFIAHIVFYGPCNRSFIDDADVVDRPIRLFHGTADNVTPIASCRSYVSRLRAAGKDVVLREYPGAHHGFDNQVAPTVANAQTVTADAAGAGSQVRVLLQADSSAECALVERTAGQIVNRDTGAPWTRADACVRKVGVTVGHDAAGHRQASQDVTTVLRDVFQLASAR
jgi:dienelactone hydrolase